jgi:hypothetical protein
MFGNRGGVVIAVLVFGLLPFIILWVSAVYSQFYSYIEDDTCRCTQDADCTVYVLVQAQDRSRVWVDTFVPCGKAMPTVMEFKQLEANTQE